MVASNADLIDAAGAYMVAKVRYDAVADEFHTARDAVYDAKVHLLDVASAPHGLVAEAVTE